TQGYDGWSSPSLLFSSSSSSASSSLLLGLSQRSRSAQYVFSKAILVSMAGGSRVLSYCEPLSCLLPRSPPPTPLWLWGEEGERGEHEGQSVRSHPQQTDPSNYVYAGLSNGSVLVYDTRDTSTHVQELQPLRSRCPVASLCYVPRAASSSFPCGGLIAGSLEGGCFWEQVNETTYRPHLLPLETAGCTDIQAAPTPLCAAC
ncbi:hypothetical protein F7725_023413, partial [Dissostichus mawsoni]